MIWKKTGLVILILLVVSLVIYPQVLTNAQGGTTVVRPTEDTTTVLINPMMGYQESDNDASNPNGLYPFSTGYLRAANGCLEGGANAICGPLNWDRINPARNVYDFSEIDAFLDTMRQRGKFGSFRIRNVVNPGDQPTVPSWARSLGVTISNGREPFGGGSYPEIDYHKCIFLDLWDDLVNELVRRYDSNPQVSFIDIGSYGYYGEWFSGKTVLERYPLDQVKDPTDPTFEVSRDTRTRIIRMFTGGSGTGKCVDNSNRTVSVSYSYTGFRNKPVLISRGDKEDVAIGIQNGAGIRFDAVGAADSKQYDFRTAVGSYVATTYQNKPIMGEFGSTSYAPLNSTYLDRTRCFAREFHLSAIHRNWDSRPSIDLTPLWRELGYRLAITSANYPTVVQAGSAANFRFNWVNRGTAPAYSRYQLWLYFKPVGSQSVLAAVGLPKTDIRKILPANVTATNSQFTHCPLGAPPPYTVDETVAIPQLAPGTYDIYFGFVEPTYGNQIQLAHTAKDSAGRYRLGTITFSPTVINNSARVKYRPNVIAQSVTELHPILSMWNGTSQQIDLTGVKMRYYFSAEGTSPMTATCVAAAFGCSWINARIVPLNPPSPTATHYLEVGFNAGYVVPGGNTNEIRVRIRKADGSAFNQSNDFSYYPFTYNFDHGNIPLYLYATRIWGISPAGVYDPANSAPVFTPNE
ncbi:MAG: hypothetical protein OHK0023_19920 [Anaerolineae bacterium]